MRVAFHDQLDDISGRLGVLVDRIGKLMGKASTALLSGDVSLADQVIAEVRGLELLRNDLEALVFRVVAQQAPVASDLRQVISANHMNMEFERMGALASHIARIAKAYPTIGTLADVAPTLNRAADLAHLLTRLLTQLLSTRDLALIAPIQDAEAAMDVVRSSLFDMALGPDWGHGIESCIRITEAARYYERYADHAVKIAERVVFVATGVDR